MKITILAVGKIKEKYFSDAIEEYKKRLSRYCKLEIVQVADEKASENAGAALEKQIRAKEAERLKKYIKEDAFVFSLAIKGREMASEEFADKIDRLGILGTSHIIFIIGGSMGLDDDILDNSDEILSFSKMTFPHRLMRVVLLEQIYRGFKIIYGEPYHK